MLKWFNRAPKRDLAGELALAQSIADVANMVAKKDRAELAQALADKMALAAQLAQACRERDDLIADTNGVYQALEAQIDKNIELSSKLQAIAEAGEASKNGTARKLARMAREAVK